MDYRFGENHKLSSAPIGVAQQETSNCAFPLGAHITPETRQRAGSFCVQTPVGETTHRLIGLHGSELDATLSDYLIGSSSPIFILNAIELEGSPKLKDAVTQIKEIIESRVVGQVDGDYFAHIKAQFDTWKDFLTTQSEVTNAPFIASDHFQKIWRLLDICIDEGVGEFLERKGYISAAAQTYLGKKIGGALSRFDLGILSSLYPNDNNIADLVSRIEAYRNVAKEINGLELIQKDAVGQARETTKELIEKLKRRGHAIARGIAHSFERSSISAKCINVWSEAIVDKNQGDSANLCRDRRDMYETLSYLDWYYETQKRASYKMILLNNLLLTTAPEGQLPLVDLLKVHGEGQGVFSVSERCITTKTHLMTRKKEVAKLFKQMEAETVELFGETEKNRLADYVLNFTYPIFDLQDEWNELKDLIKGLKGEKFGFALPEELRSANEEETLHQIMEASTSKYSMYMTQFRKKGATSKLLLALSLCRNVNKMARNLSGCLSFFQEGLNITTPLFSRPDQIMFSGDPEFIAIAKNSLARAPLRALGAIYTGIGRRIRNSELTEGLQPIGIDVIDFKTGLTSDRSKARAESTQRRRLLLIMLSFFAQTRNPGENFDTWISKADNALFEGIDKGLISIRAIIVKLFGQTNGMELLGKDTIYDGDPKHCPWLNTSFYPSIPPVIDLKDKEERNKIAAEMQQMMIDVENRLREVLSTE